MAATWGFGSVTHDHLVLWSQRCDPGLEKPEGLVLAILFFVHIFDPDYFHFYDRRGCSYYSGAVQPDAFAGVCSV